MLLAVVPDRSRIDLTARPALPGVRLQVIDVRGTIAASDSGTPPADAGLLLQVRALADAGPAAVALPRWLARDPATVTVDVGPVTMDGEAVQADAAVLAGDHLVPLTTSGRWRWRSAAGSPPHPGATEGVGAGGEAEVVGTGIVDLRGFGFGLPPLLTHVVRVRWRLALVPIEARDPVPSSTR